MIKKTVVYILLVPFLFLGFGCATMLEGPEQRIVVHCEPSTGVDIVANGAKVQLENGSFMLDKTRDTHFVTFDKEGYHSFTHAFNREINPVWPIADLIWLVGAPIAWFVDWATGSIYRIDPRDVHIVLRKQERSDDV